MGLSLPPLATVAAKARRLEFIRDYGIVVAFASLAISLSVASPIFLTKDNLLNVLDSWAPVLIVGSGVTIVLVAGGFDLSVGAVYSLAGVVAALVANDSTTAAGFAAGIAVGTGLGIVNGLLVTLLRIHSFLATLASGLAVGSIGLLITGGSVVSVLKDSFSHLGMNSVAGIPESVVLAAVVLVVAAVLLSRTTLGDRLYSVGGNADAARVAGIRVSVVRISAFAISGTTAGIGGVLAASRTSSGDLQSGLGLEFLAITAVVVGGTSIFGGEGAVWRTAVGVLFLALIGNGFNLLELNSTYQQVVNGGIILTAVAIDAWARRRHQAL